MTTRKPPAATRNLRTQSRTPADRARVWWAQRARANRYVVSPAESPSAAVTRVLRQEGLIMEVAGRRVWILVPQAVTDRRGVFLANYWPVVTLVLERYAPAAIVGLQAVKLQLGDFSPPEELAANHGANQSDYLFPLEPGFSLRLRPRPISNAGIEWLDGPAGTQIPVLRAADLLVTLDEPAVAAGIEPVAAWLRHLVVRTPDLARAVRASARPQVLQRLADLAGGLGNTPLAKQLDAAASRISGRIATPARTGVGTRILIPEVLATQPRGSGSPWVDEQSMRLDRQRSAVKVLIGKHLRTLPAFAIRRLVAQAMKSKAYDAYHNTTMEGYRISPEIVEGIVRGAPRSDGPQDEVSLRAAMAVKGYSLAFDHVLQMAKQRVPVTNSLILDLYEDLFRPSVDAGVVEPGALRGWRVDPVGLRGWRHVPPNPAKVRDLVDGLERFAGRADLDPVTRAMVVHLEFVTIHPFPDGNGRLGRLLMNLLLLQGGLPWVTVRSDERVPFFRAIERAQVDGDVGPYVRYLWHHVWQAVTEVEGKSPRRQLPSLSSKRSIRQ